MKPPFAAPPIPRAAGLWAGLWAGLLVCLAACLLLPVLAACSAPSDPAPAATNAPQAAAARADSAPTSTSLVLAEPLPGRRLKVSIHASERSLHISNCNEHVVVALIQQGTTAPAWGGASDACLSPSIIVPAGSTLSFVLHINPTTPDVNTDTPYRAQVFGVTQRADPASPPVARALVTSNEFRLLP